MSLDSEYTFELRDEFHRQKIADKVIKLLRSDVQISPLVIDGSWGLGKTEFCRKLINLMNKEDTHNLIYIDAFKADHADEPLLTVLAKVLESLPESDEKKGLIEHAMPALRYGLKLGSKALVSHILRQDTDSILDGFDEELKQVADKAIDVSVESLLKDHAEAEANLKALQEALKTVAAQKPIVLFVDELDRCRPDFAVLMLETIKHTFDVAGVQFVLVTNTTQLKAAINHCYGESIDAQRYLDKFLKFTFTLPNTVNEARYEVVLASVQHYKNLIKTNKTLSECELEQHACLRLVEQVIEVNNLSLREVETLVRYLEIYQTVSEAKPLSKDNQWALKLLSFFGVLLVSCRPTLANAILRNSVDAKKLGNFVGVSELPSFSDYNYPSHADVVMYMLGSECKINSEMFVPDASPEQEKWDELVSNYFRGAWGMGGDKKMAIVISAIQELSLSY